MPGGTLKCYGLEQTWCVTGVFLGVHVAARQHAGNHPLNALEVQYQQHMP